ncbi:MAG: hypothetical protein ACLFTR_01610 [Candidatus Woesearchaeota archaeon]
MLEFYFYRQTNPSKRDLQLYDSLEGLISKWGEEGDNIESSDIVLADITRMDTEQAYLLGRSSQQRKNICFYREMKNSNPEKILGTEDTVRYDKKEETMKEINSMISEYVRDIMRSVHHKIAEYIDDR